MALVFGLLGILLAIIRKNRLAAFIAVLLLSHILLHSVIFGMIENRYIVPIYPIILIYSAYFLVECVNQVLASGAVMGRSISTTSS